MFKVQTKLGWEFFRWFFQSPQMNETSVDLDKYFHMTSPLCLRSQWHWNTIPVSVPWVHDLCLYRIQHSRRRTLPAHGRVINTLINMVFFFFFKVIQRGLELLLPGHKYIKLVCAGRTNSWQWWQANATVLFCQRLSSLLIARQRTGCFPGISM